MNSQPIYLICGVPGAGKTWVCEQLQDRFIYVPHDEHYKDHALVLEILATDGDKPIITECPFGERPFRQELENKGLTVIPLFVITPPDLVAQQYYAREGKALPKAAYTRASRIIDRAIEWKAFYGSSEEVLRRLQNL